MSAPGLSRRHWLTFAAVLVGTLVAEAFVEHEGRFGVDGTFGFHAWYGFASCVLMVTFSKFVVGRLLSRLDETDDA